MALQRNYREFVWRDAALRICCDRFDAVTAEIVRQRAVLERFIARCPGFQAALAPFEIPQDAPEVAQCMAAAARAVGVGPMAAVAGAMAERAAQAGLAQGAEEAIVENGGDLFLSLARPAIVGLYSGVTPLADRLALAVQPGETPLAICSSSGRMGHSMSLGDCDLATVVARDAALADAAATCAANLVREEDDLDGALARISAIRGVAGVIVVKGGRVGLAGALPELIRNPVAGGRSHG